ncbi:MAG: TetR/AcrR family transcriptional regulator [Ectothiorhodospiraceae bacterium]|nr:TetR/AcrR family transcriptional regulator [Ectothiorhodospiraceae bacterium]
MAIGRPLQFDPGQALDDATQVFWAQGYASTTTRDLLQAMSLSRSSLYQTFGNKERLFIRCLDHYRRGLIDKLRTRLAAAGNGLEFVEGLFLEAAAQAGSGQEHRGCLIFTSVVEFGRQASPPAEAARASLQEIAGVFAHAIERAQADGEIAAQASPAELGLFLASSMSGVRMLLKSGTSREEITAVVRMIIAALPLAGARQTETSTTVPTR